MRQRSEGQRTAVRKWAEVSGEADSIKIARQRAAVSSKIVHRRSVGSSRQWTAVRQRSVSERSVEQWTEVWQ